MNNELGIYIHIPFCKRKCYYCDFVSFENSEEKVQKYIETIKKEIESYDFRNYDVTTIYIGGGTPSVIKSDNIVEILILLKQKIDRNHTKWEDIEITIEVNPGTVTEEKIQNYKLAGVNRLSIGLQSCKNELLKQIGRIHNYEEFLQTYKIAKSVGIKNVNIDLMIGLPNQTIQDIKETLENVIELQPQHISVYSLIVEENTKMEKMLDNKEVELPNEELERQMYWYVKNTLELKGYNQYEISNFSKKGKESKHNLNCWEQKEYIGIGVAAHSYLNKKRYSNTNNLDTYIKGEFDRDIQEIQSEEEQKREYMLLGLRKINGVQISKFKEKFGENPLYLYRKELNELVTQKLIQVDLDNIKLTNKGLDFANIVFEEFV